MIEVENFTAALVFALVLGLLNAFVRPLLMLLTLPLQLITLGLFTLVINAIVFYLASLFPVGVSVDVAIPSSRAVPLSLNHGTPVIENDPRAAVSLAMAQLFRRICPRTTADANAKNAFWKRTAR